MPKNSLVKVEPNELQLAVNAEKAKRDILKTYVQSELVDGVDFGRIPVNNSGKMSKPCLFKPGMEKILSLMSIHSHLDKDDETWEMLGSRAGTICYLCTLSKNGIDLAQGRGSATVGEKSRDANSTIKIAEKRARMDAVLSLGFSEYFTQDLDDMTSIEAPAQSGATNGDAPDGQFVAPVKKPEVLLIFSPNTKYIMTAKSGSQYAKMDTDHGTVIAFKNTMDLFQVGTVYAVRATVQEENGVKRYAIVSSAHEVTSPQFMSTDGLEIVGDPAQIPEMLDDVDDKNDVEEKELGTFEE